MEDYLVLVKMKELPGFYAKIKEFAKEEGKLYLDLDCPGTADGKLRVLFGTVQGDTAIAQGEIAVSGNEYLDSLGTVSGYEAKNTVAYYNIHKLN